MPIFMSLFAAAISLFMLFCPLSTTAKSPEITQPTTVISDLQYFHLEHKDVVAVAVETCLPAADIPDPLSYRLEAQYRVKTQANSIAITISGQQALPELSNKNLYTKVTPSSRLSQIALADKENELALTAAYNDRLTQPQITTVKRKRMINPDNTITFRTYVVVSFADMGKIPAKTIVLDAGHGGIALGATSNFLLEKDLNLDLALLCRDLFVNHGYDVYMTRTDDSNPSLLDRADAANILNADILLSIHNNSMPEDMPDAAKKLYRGTTALYNSAAPKPAKELAMLLADEVAGSLHIHQYPLQDRPGLVLLNSSWVPAVIVETAMMPHPQDAKMLSQRVYRNEAAQAILQATEKYFAIFSRTVGGNQP